MKGILFIMIPVVMGAFSLDVRWAAPSRDSLNVSVQGTDNYIYQCLDSGLELRYRFQLKLCRRRTGWVDGCEETRMVTHRVQYDPISQNYTIVYDTHGDEEGPSRIVVGSSAEALEGLSSLRVIEIEGLPRDAERIIDPKKSYVSVRVTAECRGEGTDIIAQIPYILSFGAFNPSVSDSGWVAFDLGTATLPQ